MRDVYRARKEIIAQDTKIYEESIAPEYRNIIDKLEEWINTLPKNNSILKSQIMVRGNILCELVQKVITALFNEIDSTEQKNLDELKEGLKTFRNKLDSVSQTIRENNALLRSWDSNLLHYRSSVQQYRAVSPFNIRDVAFVPNTTILEEIFKLFGKLTSSRDLRFDVNASTEIGQSLQRLSMKKISKDVKIVADISTGCESLYDIACLDRTQAWVNGEGVMTRLDVEGHIFDKISTVDNLPAHGLAVIKDGELLYSNADSNTIYLVKHGKPRAMIKTQWEPSGICFSPTGNVLAVTCKRSERIFQIEVFDGKTGSAIKDFKLLSLQGGRFLSMYLAENRNGDICIVDLNAKDVAIFTQEGSLRFRYNGADNVCQKFDPQYIATDRYGHILVSDRGNDCVHILNMDGELHSVLHHHELEDPRGITIDDEDKLWLVAKSGRVKVIQYMK
jgi:DNA-binding beta-propeller fold protein YncE